MQRLFTILYLALFQPAVFIGEVGTEKGLAFQRSHLELVKCVSLAIGEIILLGVL